MADSTAAPNFEIKIGSRKTEDVKPDVQSFLVERDMFQPDMAAIVLGNEAGQYSAMKIGDAVEISVGDNAGTNIFKGEVIGLEPVYRGGEKSRIVVRAMNKLHRLLRYRKSVTFTEKSDQQILNEVVKVAGLKLEWKHEKSITYKHVYQHNQTALEFLRTRAARLGCHVWCVDDKVFVKQPDLQQDPAIVLSTSKVGGAQEETTIRAFMPRLSSASILNKVTVKGWNPETKELITGEFSAQSSKLGKDNAVTGTGSLGNEETFTVDHPIWSKEEADALAKARLVDLSLTYITGECELSGDPKRELGEVVAIFANVDPATMDDDPFNGRYYVMGVTHRLVISRSSKDGGYTTTLRVARDAQGKVAADESQLEDESAA